MQCFITAYEAMISEKSLAGAKEENRRGCLLVQEHNVVLGLLWQQQQQCNPGSDGIPGACWLPQFGPLLLKKLDCPTQTTRSKATSFGTLNARLHAPVRSTSPPPAYAAVDSRNFSAIEE
ncbi:uncharacterized protein B0T23DRAFT_398039 [Neurospora hispaniola]|uniref:Uncharacterized protein n=1 Tax=Neurospora hispaniola TaxID=588809 RepID=A0AAJ0I4B6_9PEZI|nr:hypothetical protein B0T23DRAFT_398039 [Neurospora hispaniola]